MIKILEQKGNLKPNDNKNKYSEVSSIDDVYSNNFPHNILHSENYNNNSNNISNNSIKEKIIKRNKVIDKDIIVEENKDCIN